MESDSYLMSRVGILAFTESNNSNTTAHHNNEKDHILLSYFAWWAWLHFVIPAISFSIHKKWTYYPFSSNWRLITLINIQFHCICDCFFPWELLRDSCLVLGMWIVFTENVSTPFPPRYVSRFFKSRDWRKTSHIFNK